MNTSWKNNGAINAVWGIMRIWLGVQWLEGGYHKLVDGFDATGFLTYATTLATGDHPTVQTWYANFLEAVAIPNAGLFSTLVAYGEVLVGLGLIVGFLTIPALLAGAFMNLNFMLAGTTSTNPILYTVAMILLFAGTASSYYGVDRFALPFLKQKLTTKHTAKVAAQQ